MIKHYTIQSDVLRVEAIAKGATITRLQFLKDGKWQDTVLTYSDYTLYQDADPYFLNCFVGPHAGRIKDGVYQMDGAEVQLERNQNGNHHHGGSHGLHKLVFDVVEKPQELVFQKFDVYHSLDITIVIHVEGATMTIDYDVVPHVRQVINLTHHLYFNLSDEKTIRNHLLQTSASQVFMLDDSGAPMDQCLDVLDTPFDFRTLQRLGPRMGQNHSQFGISRNIDHPFLTRGESVILQSPRSGFGVKINSTAEATVIYTANYFEPSVSFLNRGPAQQFEGVAIESQDIPNGVNMSGWKSQIYDEAHPYTQTTHYTFFKI